jgi:metal-responsive CopG/Arc/MetJ family transcriptional regulator
MALHKTAIAVPESLLADVDRAATERGESRSAYITRVLAVAVRARRDAEITRKLDELFADARANKAQRRSAAALDEAGTDWADERW